MRTYIKENLALIIFAAVYLLFRLLFIDSYGYFRDELYYIACGQRLALGFIDHPPFIAFITHFITELLGTSLFALHIVPVLTVIAIFFLTSEMVKQMGGGKYAAFLAAIAAAASPHYLGDSNILSMNIFDKFFWTLSFLLAINILNRQKSSTYIWLGIVLGLGMMNKISVLFLIFGLFIGLILTEKRKLFLNKWLYFCIALAFLLFSPYIIWEIQNGFPTMEFMRNAAENKNMPLSPGQFTLGCALENNFFSFVIMLAGLGFYLFGKSAKPYRIFGWAFLAIYLTMVLQRAKVYYISPVNPIMLAGGAILIEQFIGKINWNWLKPALIILLIVSASALAPFAIGMLPVDSFIAYSQWIGLTPPASERHEFGLLPQHFADQFGWEQLTAAAAQAYHSLTPQEQSSCLIYAHNYGESGAVEFFGRQYNLPPVICGHNSYWFWKPDIDSVDVIICIGGDAEDYAGDFASVELFTVHTHPLAMPYESGLNIFICRDFNKTLDEVWDEIKAFI